MVYLGAVDVGSSVQERQVNRLLLLAILGMFMLIGCASNGPTAAMSRIGTFDGREAKLRELYEQHHVPLVVVGHGIYLPPPECLGQTYMKSSTPAPAPAPVESPSSSVRIAPSASADESGRKYAGQAEQRIIAGQAEQRVFGGGFIPIKCMRRGDRHGFEVMIPLGGDVQYFDGRELHTSSDGFVPLP